MRRFCTDTSSEVMTRSRVLHEQTLSLIHVGGDRTALEVLRTESSENPCGPRPMNVEISYYNQLAVARYEALQDCSKFLKELHCNMFRARSIDCQQDYCRCEQMGHEGGGGYSER